MISDKDQKSNRASGDGVKQPAGEMTQAQLEHRTISALRQYRASVTSAESARLRWIAAEAGEDRCSKVQFRQPYEKAESQHRARQLVLNHLVDQLGFVPVLHGS